MSTSLHIFDGKVKMAYLNIGSSPDYEIPKIDTQLILNGDFLFPTLNTDYLVTIDLPNWRIGGDDKFVTLYKDINLPNNTTQYIGLSYLNGTLSQDLLINNPGNYNITLYLKSLENSNVIISINNGILDKLIDLSTINSWTKFSYDFNRLMILL